MEYAIGFDFSRNMVRVLNLGDMSYRELPTHRMFVNSGNYAGMLKFAFKDTDISGSDVRIVLPDAAVACDYITTPSLKYHTRNALKVEFENIYTNESELKYNWEEFYSNKNYTTAKYVITRQSVIESVKQGVQEINCTLKGITWSPNGVVNAFMALGGRATNVNTVSGGADESKNAMSIFKSFLGIKQEEKEVKDPLPNTVLFVDVQKNVTRLVLSGKSSTLCALSQPIGYSSLLPNRVVQEYMITNHDVSELAVLNAIETAKRKKQTVAVASDLTDEEEAADDAYMEMLESLSNKDGAPIPKKKKEEEDDSAEFFEDPDEKKEEAAAAPSEPKPFDKIQKKQEKKYPKFMQREKPADAEGYVMENFRILQKYILLFVQNTENSTYFNSPQRVVLNVPPEFAFIAPRLNEEKDNGVQFELLENGGNVSATALENLDLYGASLSERYNKLYNFN